MFEIELDRLNFTIKPLSLFFLLLLHSAQKKFIYALVEVLDTRLDRESCLSNKYRALILERKQYCIF